MDFRSNIVAAASMMISSPRRVSDHPLKLLIAAQCRRQGRKKSVGRQFVFRFVVIDVVIDDDPPLRRLARLARPQYDTERFTV